MPDKHEVVSSREWMAARKKLLAKEKAFTRQRDELSQLRRELPWERVEKEYVFETPGGPLTLAELFDGRRQLIVYHFMFSPEWKAGCPHCSHWADSFNGIIVHLNQRDVTMLAASRAPLRRLQAYRKRMGWSFKWVSSGKTDFNFDFQASFTEEDRAQKRAVYNFQPEDPGSSDREGISVFYKDPRGRIFRTYSAYARGIDMMSADYQYLDLVPKGRDERGRGPFWVRRHDEYPR